jgi:CBS domain-containing protein
LRPYMIERPFYVCQKDTLEKCHTIFRHIHVRQLMVVNNKNEKLEGIITRQDLFQYMSL